MNAHYIIRPVIFQGFDVYYLKNDKCNTYSREDEKTFRTFYDLRHIIYANVYKDSRKCKRHLQTNEMKSLFVIFLL